LNQIKRFTKDSQLRAELSSSSSLEIKNEDGKRITTYLDPNSQIQALANIICHQLRVAKGLGEKAQEMKVKNEDIISCFVSSVDFLESFLFTSTSADR
jgi:hypothetical protein